MDKKHKILIVDDDSINIELLENILKDKYALKSVDSGETALSVYKDYSPELILLDIMMPGINGIEICRTIRADKEFSCKIILLSGKNQVDERLEGYEAGADDYVTKPFIIEELEAKIEAILRLRRFDELEKLIEKRTLELEKSNEQLKLNEIKIWELNKQLEKKFIDSSEKLKTAQDLIIKTKYKSELADLTTGTLHNVKNILNSVKISSGFMHNVLAGEALTGFRKANDLLRTHINNIEAFILDDPKGKKLLHYYLALEKMLDKEIEEANYHQERLLQKVHAIESIVNTQQGYGGKVMTEEVVVEDIIEDALTMQKDLLENNHIRIEKKFNPVPRINAQKTKFMHILVNLIKNSAEAMAHTTNDKKRLTLSTEHIAPNVYVTVTDTGEGIKRENIQHIFKQGYTTKHKGHGFGLHSCANYMDEMNGSIWIESDGPGKGATLYMKFPVQK